MKNIFTKKVKNKVFDEKYFEHLKVEDLAGRKS